MRLQSCTFSAHQSSLCSWRAPGSQGTATARQTPDLHAAREALLCPSSRGSACLRAGQRVMFADRCLSSATPKLSPEGRQGARVEAVRVLGTAPLGHPQWLRSRWPEMTRPDLPARPRPQPSPVHRKEPFLWFFSDILPERRFGRALVSFHRHLREKLLSWGLRL